MDLYQINAKGKHILLYALSKEEFSKFHATVSAKEL